MFGHNQARGVSGPNQLMSFEMRKIAIFNIQLKLHEFITKNELVQNSLRTT